MMSKPEVLKIILDELEGRVDSSTLERLARRVADVEEQWEEVPIFGKEEGTAFALWPDIFIPGEFILSGGQVRVLVKRSSS